MEKIDYLIVGGGLAGITMAHHLLDKNKKIILYTGTHNSSSRVAAGLFNPIAGRQMVKTWKADDIFPYLNEFYTKIERRLNSHFYHKIPIYRPFFSIEEQNDWQGKSTNSQFQPFIQEVFIKSQFDNRFEDPYGGLLLQNSGWVDTNVYIEDSLRYFEQHPNIQVVRTNFETNNLLINNESLIIDEIVAKNIVFTEGVLVSENPLFKWLPVTPLKGEIMEIQIPFDKKVIINRGVFILPYKNGNFKVGSTYQHNDTTWSPTENGKKQLIEKLENLMHCEYDLIKLTAGIRPASKDRRPIMGKHPKYKNIFAFNGLGTKGVSLSPYFANQLTTFMEEGKELDKEVNIERYFSLYCTQEEEI